MIKLMKAEGITTDEKVTMVPIATVKLWKDNPRKNDAAAPKLAEIIKARGQITPIVVWRKNMTAYKGNTTIKACRMLGYKTIKVLFADFPSETSAIAYGIADNKSSEFSEWDDDLLLGFLKNTEVQSLPTGFDIKSEGLFNVNVTVNIFTGIADVLKVKSLQGPTSLKILERAYILENKISVSNLDTTFSMDCKGKDGIVDLSILSATGTIMYTEEAIDDFPKVPTLSKLNEMPKDIFYGIGTLLPFCTIDTSRPLLCDVNFLQNKLVFGTDGIKGKFRYVKDIPIDFRIEPVAVSIISYLYDRITKVQYDEKYLLFTGEGFSFSCKYSVDIVDFLKVVPVFKDTDFKTVSDITSVLKHIAPCAESHKVCLDSKRGVLLPKQFGVNQKIEMALSAFNIDSLILCFKSKVFQCDSANKPTIFFDDTFYYLIMPLRITEPCADVPMISLKEPDTGVDVSFDYDVAGNTVHGKIKSISKEACKLFIERNFKNAKLR